MNSQLTNRRWFEIKGDQMYYFKTKDVSPTSIINIKKYKICVIESCN